MTRLAKLLAAGQAGAAHHCAGGGGLIHLRGRPQAKLNTVDTWASGSLPRCIITITVLEVAALLTRVRVQLLDSLGVLASALHRYWWFGACLDALCTDFHHNGQSIRDYASSGAAGARGACAGGVFPAGAGSSCTIRPADTAAGPAGALIIATSTPDCTPTAG